MASKSASSGASPDSGVGRRTEPGPRGRKSDLTTGEGESSRERNVAGPDFEGPEGEVMDVGDDFEDEDFDFEDDDDLPAIHETDLHSSMHADHDGESTDDDDIHQEWNDGILDLKSLTAPRPNPGMVQRWVKIMNPDGTPDTNNWSKKARLGWKPRSTASMPKRDRYLPVERHEKLGEVIQVAGLVLCEMEQRQADRISRAVKARTHKLRLAAAAPVRTASRAGVRAGYGAGIVVDADTSTVTRAPRGRR